MNTNSLLSKSGLKKSTDVQLYKNDGDLVWKAPKISIENLLKLPASLEIASYGSGEFYNFD